MGNFRRKILMASYKLSDMLIMVGSFMIATIIISHADKTISIKEFLHMQIRIQNFIMFLGLLFSWHLISYTFGLYNSKRFSERGRESLDVLKATSTETLICWSTVVLFDVSMITPEFLLIFWGTSSSACIVNRLTLRKILKCFRLRGHNLRFMLIVGTNERAVRLSKKIKSHPELGYILLGFVENNWRGNQDFLKSGYRIVTDFDSFASFIRENVVDEVVACLPVRSCYNQIMSISKICEEHGVIFRHLSDLYNSKRVRASTDYFEGEPVITLYNGSMSGWQVSTKRIIDVLLSVFLLLILAPLLLTVVFLVKITSPGPVFFVQERVGLNKRRFKIYKFRTMIPEAEKKQAELECFNELSGPVFKIKNDPRITAIGKILRKTSIDELPQLYNVITGDMSLVGPRALPVRDFNGFDHDRYRRRFSIRPGITCLWQINGRNNIPFDRWMELDLEYVDNWSLWMDFKILLKTIPAVLSGFGAA